MEHGKQEKEGGKGSDSMEKDEEREFKNGGR